MKVSASATFSALLVVFIAWNGRAPGLTSVITIFAGNGTPGFSGDGGPATSAQLNSPISLAKDTNGNVFIADAANHRVRKVSPTSVISTFAGKERIPFTPDECQDGH